MFKYLRKNEKGFTLIELLVVIAIIGILAAVIAPNAFKAIEKSKVAAVEADYKAIKSATLNFYTDTSQWPSDVNAGVDPGFMTEPATPADLKGWNGPYLERWPENCPLGGEYDYNNNNSNVRYLTITGITKSARDRLDNDLDGGDSKNDGVVQWDSDDDSTSNTINLYISND